MAAQRQPTPVGKPDQSRYPRRTLFVTEKVGSWAGESAFHDGLAGALCCAATGMRAANAGDEVCRNAAVIALLTALLPNAVNLYYL